MGVTELLPQLRKLKRADKLYVMQFLVSELAQEEAENKIRRTEFHKALKISSGAWKDENHPELSSIDNIAKYVSDMRRENDKRLKEIYHE